MHCLTLYLSEQTVSLITLAHSGAIWRDTARLPQGGCLVLLYNAVGAETYSPPPLTAFPLEAKTSGSFKVRI